ncbi:acid protease [Mycena alexandri]|uniref:Acid protease n=1 Tax=Mycena alexandri TaxID=1745969 RepID=A0AAD6X899_9AGAR|nr:acid protease [Mycena alexandri]
MFNKAALLVALTLAISIVASPASAPALANTSARGITIPLRKKGVLTRANGVFDKDKAIVDAVLAHNKHRQNLINLAKNRGHSALPTGAVIQPLATIPRAIQRQMKKRQAEVLIDQGETEWTGAISIGTPAQNFQIDFDTGSADLWVVSSDCTGSACSSHSKFSTSSSSTAREESGSFSIQYGDKSTVISVAGVEVKGQFFSPVNTLSSSFAQDPADGILGLAFPAISNLNQPPFFDAAHDQGAIEANQFGFFLAGSGSELYLGGVDASKFTGDIEYHGVDTSTGFWEITGGSVKVGSSLPLLGIGSVKNIEAIIDSGTTIMYGPPSAVGEIYAQVPGAALFDAQNGYYLFPCESPPQIAFNWGGADWVISAENINLGTTTAGSSDCVGALAAKDFGLGSTFVLGDSFMKNSYVVFDADRNAVGFAALA